MLIRRLCGEWSLVVFLIVPENRRSVGASSDRGREEDARADSGKGGPGQRGEKTVNKGDLVSVQGPGEGRGRGLTFPRCGGPGRGLSPGVSGWENPGPGGCLGLATRREKESCLVGGKSRIARLRMPGGKESLEQYQF